MLLSLQLSEETRKNRPEIGRALGAGFRSYDRRALIRSVDAVLVKRDAFLEKLAEIETPALVVSGAQDTILPTSIAKRIAGRLRNARQVEVEGAAHFVPVEHPDFANRLIFDFVGNLRGVSV